jgi:hypothetical protein
MWVSGVVRHSKVKLSSLSTGNNAQPMKVMHGNNVTTGRLVTLRRMPVNNIQTSGKNPTDQTARCL